MVFIFSPYSKRESNKATFINKSGVEKEKWVEGDGAGAFFLGLVTRGFTSTVTGENDPINSFFSFNLFRNSLLYLTPFPPHILNLNQIPINTARVAFRKFWLPKTVMANSVPYNIIDLMSKAKGAAAGTAICEVDNDADHSTDAKKKTSVQVRPKLLSSRLAGSRRARRRPKKKVLRTKDRSSAQKWPQELDFPPRFKKAAADIGKTATELIVPAFRSNTEGVDLTMASALEAAFVDPEAIVRYDNTMTLMKQIYQDIHVCSAPELINSTSEIECLLGLEPSAATGNEKWIEFDLGLETQAMFGVIDRAIAASESVLDGYSTTVHTGVNRLSNQPDTLGRTSDMVAMEIHLSQRYASFAAEHGWMMLSMLANSAAFREAARALDDSLWTPFNISVCQNKNSIEYFAKIRGLDWTRALRRKPDHIKDLREGHPGIEPDHPHTHIVPRGSQPLRKPHYRGTIQTNIDTNHFGPFRSYGRSRNPALDPTYHRGRTCKICRSTSCHCDPSRCPGVLRPLVELVESGDGVAIRALQPIGEKQLLAEYVGEIVPDRCHTDDRCGMDDTYSLSGRGWYAISAHELGNWTRFVNHSCAPNAAFVSMVIGRKHRWMLRSCRDINMFEEVTVDYGVGYWVTRGLVCRCGAIKCRFATGGLRDQTVLEDGFWSRRVCSHMDM